MRHRLLPALAALAFTLTAPLAAAQDPSPTGAQPPAAETAPEPAVAPAKAPAPAAKAPDAVARTMSCACQPEPLPLYVEDWGRLANLTREDSRVFGHADFWRTRQESTRWLVAGIVIGGGVSALATADRLGAGEWSDRNKWMLVGGLTTALVSTLAYWAFSPDRDDLLTVLNQWNLRHPDRPLAP